MDEFEKQVQALECVYPLISTCLSEEKQQVTVHDPAWNNWQYSLNIGDRFDDESRRMRDCSKVTVVSACIVLGGVGIVLLLVMHPNTESVYEVSH